MTYEDEFRNFIGTFEVWRRKTVVNWITIRDSDEYKKVL